MMRRCTIFLGLLVGCAELPDGTSVLRSFPALNCDEIGNRASMGWAGTLVLCVGLPLIYTILAALYLNRKFKSSLSYFLVRSVFSGCKDSASGFGFKLICLGRTFFLVFIVSSPSWIGDVSQLIGIQALCKSALFLEGITQPRTTAFMSIVESAEEICILAFVAICFSATGSQVHSCCLLARAQIVCRLQLPLTTIRQHRYSVMKLASTVSSHSSWPLCCFFLPTTPYTISGSERRTNAARHPVTPTLLSISGQSPAGWQAPVLPSSLHRTFDLPRPFLFAQSRLLVAPEAS
jgi:hypothetical protein